MYTQCDTRNNKNITQNHTHYIHTIHILQYIHTYNNNKQNKMIKTRRNISLDFEVNDDIERLIKEEKFNFSEWVQETWIKNKLSERGQRRKQKKYEKLAKKWRNSADQSAKKRLIFAETLSKEQFGFLKEAKSCIKRNKNFTQGQLNRWNNKFKSTLTMTQFKELLDLEELNKQ